MKRDVFDALLEHALRDELGPRRSADALAARVAAAFAAAPSAGSARVQSLVPPLRRRSRSRFVVAVAMAAAAVVVAVLVTRSADIALADSPLDVAAADGVFARDVRVPPGRLTRVNAEEVALHLPDGVEVAAVAGSVLQWSHGDRGAELELLAGGATVTAPRVCSVRLAGTALHVDPGGRVECATARALPDPSDSGDPVMNATELRRRLENASRLVVTVAVLAGTAEFATAQGVERLAAGDRRSAGDAQGRADAARAAELYAAARTDLPPPVDEASILQWKAAEEQIAELHGLLLRSPAAQAAIRGRLARDVVDGQRDAETRARLVRVALLVDDPAMNTALGNAWKIDAGLFSFEEQLAMVERGFAAASAPVVEFLKEPQGALSARAAAVLAMAGDASQRPTLETWERVEFASTREDVQRFDARCEAAVALAALGEQKATERLRGDLRVFIESLLATDDLQDTAVAASFLQRAAYVLAVPRPRLSFHDLRVQHWHGVDVGSGVDAIAVRKALDQVAPPAR